MIGYNYQNLKDYKNAAIHYNMAIEMKNHEYQIGIGTHAKEGLRRLKQR
jgi:hypothetical protein